MNSSVITKRTNIAFLVAASVMSLAMLGVGGALLNYMVSGAPGKYLQVAEKSCTNALQTNGFISDSSTPGEIKASRTNDQIETLVYQSGVLIASCPAYALSEYCAGAECKVPGVSFTLKLK